MTIYGLEAPQKMRGKVALPASKSLSNRALIVCALAHKGEGADSVERGLKHLAECDDTFVMRRALRQPEALSVDIMAAGTAMRFLTAYYAVTEGERVITGTERMKNRPIALLVDALRALGADITYAEREGFPPLRIKGRTLKGGTVTLAGNVSSQYISALLLIAPMLSEGLVLRLTGDVMSRSYIDMTLALMRDFGAKADWEEDHVIKVEPQPYQRGVSYEIESDWSASSYWYELMALTDDAEAVICLPRLYEKSLQGDRRVADLFADLGVKTTFTPDGAVLTKQERRISRFDVDLTLQPDLAQTFVTTCSMLGVPFQIAGLQTLRIKETDRIAALQTELHKLGFHLTEEAEGILAWNGERHTLVDTTFDTYEDHRMAMSLAPCALRIDNIKVREPQVVSKSYPDFWQHLIQVGFKIREE